MITSRTVIALAFLSFAASSCASFKPNGTKALPVEWKPYRSYALTWYDSTSAPGTVYLDKLQYQLFKQLSDTVIRNPFSSPYPEFEIKTRTLVTLAIRWGKTGTFPVVDTLDPGMYQFKKAVGELHRGAYIFEITVGQNTAKKMFLR